MTRREARHSPGTSLAFRPIDMHGGAIGLSVIIPFKKNLNDLRKALDGLRPIPVWAEVVVVADGAVEPCHQVVHAAGGRVVYLRESRGPAVARNIGAATACGEVLLFLDADVVPAPDAVQRVRDLMERHPHVSAVFGAYDEEPHHHGFISQYKNLSHSYFHQISEGEANTFWAGLGAIRRTAFVDAGGFDERFSRPSVEDIELGYRLTALGYRILLDPSVRGCHLKRWTGRSAVRSDVFDRGIPWTQLTLKFKGLDKTLNLATDQRVAVCLTYALLVCVLLSLTGTGWLIAAALMLGLLTALNRKYYAFFRYRRGFWFSCRVVPVHILHHLCNGVSFATGVMLYHASLIGLTLPGAVPLGVWDRRQGSRSSIGVNGRTLAG